jgi:hypothetical protein
LLIQFYLSFVAGKLESDRKFPDRIYRIFQDDEKEKKIPLHPIPKNPVNPV